MSSYPALSFILGSFINDVIVIGSAAYVTDSFNNKIMVVDADKAIDAIKGTGIEAWYIGQAVDDPERRIRLRSEGLIGHSKHFVRE